jgi:hypothetical protein
MPTINYKLARGDAEIMLEIDYSVAPFDPGCSVGPPECCDPPSGGEIDDLAIFGPDGNEFTPSAVELQQIEDFIYANHDYEADDYAD